MAESPPRGAERDLFRDTWVRYLGESRARGHGDSPTLWLGKEGVAGRWFGSRRWWEDLCSHSAPGPEIGLREV